LVNVVAKAKLENCGNKPLNIVTFSALTRQGLFVGMIANKSLLVKYRRKESDISGLHERPLSQLIKADWLAKSALFRHFS